MEHATVTVLVLIVIFSSAILYKILSAHAGKEIFIRKIPGIAALDEAMGRATEMGRPIVFSPGLGGVGQVQLAAIAVMAYLAKSAARFNTRILVPISDPTLYPVAAEVLRETYHSEGNPELYDPEDVRFFSGDQSVFAAATCGMIERERAAANFMFGSYGFESLLLAETGQRCGCIQVAATVDMFQVPFFICTCDYVMIGEELYAASAYLSRNPTYLGSLVAQDMGKALIMLMIIIGVVATGLAVHYGAKVDFNWFTALLGK